MKKKAMFVWAVLVVTTIAAILLSYLKEAQKDTWLEKCRAAYEQFHSTQTMYYTSEQYHASAFKKDHIGKLALLYNYHCWLDGRDFYDHYDKTNGRDRYSLRVGNVKYQSEWKWGKPEGWTSAKNVYNAVAFRHESWEEFVGDKEMSVQHTFEGTRVRFFEDLGYHNCTISRQTMEYFFCFDREGKLLRVESNFVTYNGTEIVPGNEHSIDFSVDKIQSTNEEEVRAKIQEVYEEVHH